MGLVALLGCGAPETELGAAVSAVRAPGSVWGAPIGAAPVVGMASLPPGLVLATDAGIARLDGSGALMSTVKGAGGALVADPANPDRVFACGEHLSAVDLVLGAVTPLVGKLPAVEPGVHPLYAPTARVADGFDAREGIACEGVDVSAGGDRVYFVAGGSLWVLHVASRRLELLVAGMALEAVTLDLHPGTHHERSVLVAGQGLHRVTLVGLEAGSVQTLHASLPGRRPRMGRDAQGRLWVSLQSWDAVRSAWRRALRGVPGVPGEAGVVLFDWRAKQPLWSAEGDIIAAVERGGEMVVAGPQGVAEARWPGPDSK